LALVVSTHLHHTPSLKSFSYRTLLLSFLYLTESRLVFSSNGESLVAVQLDGGAREALDNSMRATMRCVRREIGLWQES
jgi:hypothetical protein